MSVEIRVFTTPAYNVLRFALARKDSSNRNQYMLVLAEPYGMAPDRRVAILNQRATADKADLPALTPSGHPLIWFDCTTSLNTTTPESMLDALLQAEPPVLKLTGRTREVPADSGGLFLAREVEILLGEDELAHVCCYCGVSEFFEPSSRYERCGSDPGLPRYICPSCKNQFGVTRNLRWALKYYLLGGL